MIANATQWVPSTKWRLTYNGGQKPLEELWKTLLLHP